MTSLKRSIYCLPIHIYVSLFIGLLACSPNGVSESTISRDMNDVNMPLKMPTTSMESDLAIQHDVDADSYVEEIYDAIMEGPNLDDIGVVDEGVQDDLGNLTEMETDLGVEDAECQVCGSCGIQKCYLWYSPSNAGVAGGSLSDFIGIFDRPNEWSEARTRTKVLYLRASTLRQFVDTDLIETQLVPRLLEWDMRLALDVNGATWAKCWAEREARLGPDTRLMERIHQAGGQVDFIALQSVLSKHFQIHYLK